MIHWARTSHINISHHDVIKWKHFPRYWPFVRGIHRSPVNSPRIGQWRGALMFTLIYAQIKGWVNNREAGDLRRYRGHNDVTVISLWIHGTGKVINHKYPSTHIYVYIYIYISYKFKMFNLFAIILMYILRLMLTRVLFYQQRCHTSIGIRAYISTLHSYKYIKCP